MDTAIRFLKKVRPRGPWTVTAIHPDLDGAPTRTFIKDKDVEEMREWLVEKNKTCGVYFCSNPTRQRLQKRPREGEISFFQYVTLDFDPAKDETSARCKERVRVALDKFLLKPTFVWSSGNGMQAMWRVAPPVELASKNVIASCKLVARGMTKKLGGDKTYSVEHIFRLPGTMNYPNAAKRAAGRKPVRAGDFTYNDCAYDIFEFPKAKPTQKKSVHVGLVVPVGGWNTEAGINDAIRYFQTTNDISREGVSGTAIRTALKARDYGVSTDKCFSLMWEYWVPRCEYQWGEGELRNKIERSYNFAVNDPGCETIEYALKFEFAEWNDL